MIANDSVLSTNYAILVALDVVLFTIHVVSIAVDYVRLTKDDIAGSFDCRVVGLDLIEISDYEEIVARCLVGGAADC